MLRRLVGRLRWRANWSQRNQQSPRGSGLTYFSETHGFIELPREVQRADAQTQSRETVCAGRLNKRIQQSAAKAFGPVILSHRHCDLRCGGVHKTVGVDIRRPEAKPCGANSFATLFCNDRPVSSTLPVGERLRELRGVAKRSEQRALGGCIPEEGLKEHLLEEIQVCRVAWSKLNHSYSSRLVLILDYPSAFNPDLASFVTGHFKTSQSGSNQNRPR